MGFVDLAVDMLPACWREEQRREEERGLHGYVVLRRRASGLREQCAMPTRRGIWHAPRERSEPKQRGRA